jgi:hypothetical protein
VRSAAPAVGAAVWTTNRVLAAPVVVSQRHLAVAEPQAVVVNSGSANAATGAAGIADAERTAEEVAHARPPTRGRGSLDRVGSAYCCDRVVTGVRGAARRSLGSGAHCGGNPHDRPWAQTGGGVASGFAVGAMAKEPDDPSAL